METQALHVTETKTLSSSLMSNTEKCIDNDEITPEMEDQLLSDNFSEDQVLEDEDDAQSEGSIRLRYSDVEADDDENADKSSGASESALNNPLKKIHDDMANESSVVRDDNLIPIYTNGINDDLDKIDFTEDDTLLGINFCNNDDNENDLLSVKEIIDKTITLNQFSQSAYDNSWRLGGKSSRYRHKNYHNFLRISNFKQLQNNSYIPDTLNLNYYNIRKTCERLKNSTNENVNSNDKKVYLNKKNTSLLPPSSSSSSSPPKFMTKIFPPISKIQTNDNVIIKSKNDMIDEKLDNPKNNISNVDIIEKNNKMTDKNFDQGTDESTDSLQFELPKKQVNGILDNINIDKSQLVNNKNTTTATTTTTEVTVSSSDDIEKNPNKNVEIITNGVESTEVVENIDTKNDNTEIEATKTDESSDSGFVSTSASVTENDEILKDTNEELIKDKIVINEQPPILTPEIEIEQENKNNNVNEIMEINNSEIIVTEINKNEECIHVLEREEPTLNVSTNDLEKTEETIITDDSKLVESMDIVTIDEVTVGSNVEKIDKIEEKSNDVDVKTTSSDNEKVDMIVDDQESIGTSNNEISVINQEQQVDSPDGSSKQQCNKRKRKSIKTIGDSLDPEKENLRLRVKRETAQKAEELIRKDSQMANDDSDSDSYDIKIKPTTSPNSLKRTNEMTDLIDNKRLKIDNKIEPKIEIKTETYLTNRKIKPFTNLRKILLRDCKQKLTNMRQEDLEELLIQKIIETITMRDEIGKLREQAKLSERAKELSQQKCASLAKQIKDFEMIINRYASDREKNPDIYLAPTKINRSVGLQVNFLTDRGVQNLRQVNNKISQQNTTTINKNNNINNHANNNNNNMNNINNNNNRLINNSSTQVIVSGVSMSGGNMSTTVTSMQIDDSNVQLRKGIKIRSPRRGGDVHPQVIANIQNQLPNQMNIINSITSPIVVPKVNDTRITIAPTNSPTAQSNNNNNNTSIIVNGNSPNIQYRQTRNTTINNQNNNNNNINNRTSINGENLIDLTEEEEKTKILSGPPALTALVAPVTTSTTLPKNQQRQTRMIPSNSSAHVTISQPNIRVVTGQQGQPTGIVNNVNGQRVIFMHPGGSPSRQLILTSAASTSRTSVVTAASSSRNSFINIAPSGITTVPKTTPVRVMPGANPPVQLVKHPAPLPATPTHTHNPLWKMSPPAPSLKISKVTHGIVLSWNMILSDKCADIASYQLFAYQEISTTPPSSSLWKKVGDVRALPLPMACTLTQFLEGNNYYFAVRAVDCHGRLGEFSLPGNITL
ncbi:putative uncharacterized protein DDB_G0291812 isoform X2 [Aphidius gifuensis]|uniref:putative uncharacterized protein DDB_G0291812 isoform X2 n=1 Tax=Aphidius gifuensis TaxID=684658 RepID=UPI001CDBF529|nr:putative uncharacterized protein DDB_G0291812 isoform X2 [Aphidius gifuensis]